MFEVVSDTWAALKSPTVTKMLMGISIMMTCGMFLALVIDFGHFAALCLPVAMLLVFFSLFAVTLHLVFGCLFFGSGVSKESLFRDNESDGEEEGTEEPSGRAPLLQGQVKLTGSLNDGAAESKEDEEAESEEPGSKVIGSRKATPLEKRIGWLLSVGGRGICVISVLLLWGVTIAGLSFRSKTLVDYTASFYASSYKGKYGVDVSRGDGGSGTVHLVAKGEGDLFFAQGVAHAQSRWWQMEFQRRVGRGTLSELVGDAGVDVDTEMRVLGVYEAAERAALSLPADAKAAMQAYVNGVNAWIQSVSKQRTVEESALGAPAVPDKWTMADSMVWAKLMSFDLSGNMDRELMRYKLFTNGHSVERVNDLWPVYNSSRFPVVLSPKALYEAGVPLSKGADTTQTYGCNQPPVPPTAGPEPPAGPYPGPNVGKPTSESASLAGMSESLRRTPLLRAALGFGASNNWVIGGNRTTTKKPILANDPHLQLSAPSIWILVHLETTDDVAPIPGAENHSASKINAIGASFPGLPGVVTGRNEHIAWGVTNTGADVQDLYLMEEKDDPNNAGKKLYQYRGQWIPYNYTTETIKVKGGKDKVIEVRTSVYGRVVTDHGVADGSGAAMSLRWVSTDPTINDTTLASFYYLNKASDVVGFRAALAHYVAPSQNFVFASTDGDIAYQMPGKIPLRSVAHNGAWPVPGNGSAEFEWSGFIPYDDLPRALNPPEGFIATANNRVTPPGYPHEITADWDAGSDGYRAMRITDRICEKATHSPEEVQSIQLDLHSQLSLDLAAAAQLLDPSRLSADGKNMQKLLAAWNGDTSVGSTEQVLAMQWYTDLLHLAGHATNSTYWHNSQFLLRLLHRESDPACGHESCPNAVAAALDRVADANKDALPGASTPADAQQWGLDVHQAMFQHAILGNSPLACIASRNVSHGGDESTVNVGSFSVGDPTMTQIAGPSYRHIVDLSDMDGGSVFLNPLGQDGNQFSPHYDDLLDDWAQGNYLQMTTKNFKADASSLRILPVPANSP